MPGKPGEWALGRPHLVEELADRGAQILRFPAELHGEH
jgi:hypothetical protein